MKNVAIIGGAGFIGSHVTKQLLEAGHRVRVSATKPEDTARYAHLQQLAGAGERLELLPLNLLDAAAIPTFIEGCEAVIHTGTPFQLEVNDPVKDLIEPTVQGTKNLLAAVTKDDTVKNLVIVASVGALNTHFPLDPPTRKETITEADEYYFSAEDHPYAQAKYLAHQAVEAFLEDYRGDCQIVSVSPVGVMGPSLSDRQDSTSTGLAHLIKHNIAPNPFIQMLFDQDVNWAIVGVEDVARGIIKATQIGGLHGRNFLLSAESRPISDQRRIMNGEAPLQSPTTVYDASASEQALDLTYASATDFLSLADH